MSNVLIGIIGVILFIGLALAGALILGDDFKSSKSATNASIMIANLQQIVQALNMYQLKTGAPFAANVALTTLQPRFLKSVPTNPLAGTPYRVVDAAGYTTGQPVDVAYTRIGSDDASKAICRALEEQAGATDPDASLVAGDWVPTIAARRRVGCLLYSQNMSYYAYIPI